MTKPYWKAGTAERRRVREARVAFSQDRRRLKVGLVNNMPDAALIATERQFHALLSAAAPERRVDLHLFQVPAIERGPAASKRLDALYRPVAQVDGAGLDALIVTGAEPRAGELRAEPFWPALAQLADWATDAQTPTLWSCLAAHAAVSHLDRIERRPLARKCSGLFACFVAAPEHPLLRGWPGPALTPHSRANALEEADLIAAGYTVLTRSPEAGVDSFVRRSGAGGVMLFLQGHPEYEPNSLALEFRRDLQRYLAGAGETPPELPWGVFGGASTRILQALVDTARQDRRPELMSRWPLSTEITLAADSWRRPAVRLYRNWLRSACDASLELSTERRIGV